MLQQPVETAMKELMRGYEMTRYESWPENPGYSQYGKMFEDKNGDWIRHTDAISFLNRKLELAAKIVDDSSNIDYAPNNGPAACIRAMKVIP